MDKPNEIKVLIESAAPTAQGEVPLKIQIQIDGMSFGGDLAVSIHSLAKSCQTSGEMEIFTCGCGIAACAGIYDGIRVKHTDCRIEWCCPDPLADDPNMGEGLPRCNWTHFYFDPGQYVAAVSEGLRHLYVLAMMQPKSCWGNPALDNNPCSLLEIDPAPFSSRDCFPERTIVTQSMTLDAFAMHLKIGGVYYSVESLGLPEDILEIYLEAQAMQSYPSSRDALPTYHAYLDACRRFCAALRKHVDGKSSVQLIYHPPEVFNRYAWEVSEWIR